MTKTVFVKGSIIADCGYHSAKNIECPARTEDEETADIVINGDLHLNEETTLTPYYFYKARKSVSATYGNIGCFTNPHFLQLNLTEELNRIVILSNINFQGDLQQIELKSLYGAVFGSFEAFITIMIPKG